MSAVAGSSGRPERGNPLLPIVFFASPLVTSAVPRLTPLFLGLVGLALIGAALRRGTPWRQLLPPTPALAACLLLVLYVFINTSWAAAHDAALGKAVVLAGVVLVAFAAAAAATTLEAANLRRAALALAAGAFAGAIFMLIEIATGGVITRALVNLVPLLRPDSAKHISISHGEVIGMHRSKFNQNINLVMFHLWPGLLALAGLGRGTRRAMWVAAFLAALAAAVAISEHDSSQVALVGSGLVFLLALNWPRAVVRGLAVLWCAAFVLVLPADFLAYRAGLHLAPWLPESARARVIIWEYTAERTLAHPWLGVGVASTPVLRDEERPVWSADQPEGFVFHRTTGQHAHDLFLQTWYELGAVGGVLMALAGVAVVMLILLLRLFAQPFAAASFAAFAAVGAFAWGMWQVWFMCAIGLVPLYVLVAAAVAEARRQSGPPVKP
jgi:O-antigen ligase